jgi:hypothetical protein
MDLPRYANDDVAIRFHLTVYPAVDADRAGCNRQKFCRILQDEEMVGCKNSGND